MKQKLLVRGLAIGLFIALTLLGSDLLNGPIASAPPGSYQQPAAVMAVQTPSPAPMPASNDAKLPANNQVAKPPVIPERVVEGKVVTSDNKTYPLRTYKPLLVPNDPKGGQWWTANARLEQAWDIPGGSNPTLLAIIDTGFALQHEEFANRWHTNPGESGPATVEQPSSLNCADRSLALDAACNLIDDNGDGVIDNEAGAVTYQNPSRLNCSAQGRAVARDCNRIDDDGNGLIDDWRGWDFINYDNSTQAGELNPNGTGTHHGTYVAGAAAATGNNGKGMAGADWGTTILPLQALDDDSYGDTLSVGRAIRYAAAQGADVISLSLGSELSDEFVRQAIAEAIRSGSVVVAASGNDGCECIIYPANYPEVVAVGALGTTNQPASFSSWGDNLDILAPGVGLYTTDWAPANQTSAYAGNIAGTSLATPLVSGTLSRLLSHQPKANTLQLIAALTENTNRLTLDTILPRSNQLGFGTLDAGKAAQRMTTSLTVNQLYTFTPVSAGNKVSPNSPAEVSTVLRAYQCESSAIGTTPIFELIKESTSIFSVSPAEAYQATQSGYSSKLFAYACLQQPHDQALILRNINILQEFRNVSAKP